MLEDTHIQQFLSRLFMKTSSTFRDLHVNSEIGKLRKIIIHHPDKGVANFPPNKMHEILYDDIVDQKQMKTEYSHYLETLYWFLDPELIKANLKTLNSENRLDLFTPGTPLYMVSNNVMDVEAVLGKILENEDAKTRIVSAVGGIERLSLNTQNKLIETQPRELASTLITGITKRINKDGTTSNIQIFPPIPNQIFTRDTSVTIEDHIFITKPKERARFRERLIASYLAKYQLIPYDNSSSRIIDLEAFGPEGYPEPDEKLTIEGGDMMMIAPGHLIVGLSQRTNIAAIEALINHTFSTKLLSKVTIVKIPNKRDFMHIDTVFTQIKKDMWVVFGPFSKMGYEREKNSRITNSIMHDDVQTPVSIFQYKRKDSANSKKTYEVDVKEFPFLEDLLSDVTTHDLLSKSDARFVYSAGGEPLFEEREQWTDSCNFLALRDGVIIGYDRNTKTTEALKNVGFEVIRAADLNIKFREACSQKEGIERVITGDTLILLDSYELSRARGGAHCMSQPILRDELI